jgi:hypothetical protein
MSAFKLHTLKQKLWAIVAASFVARVIMFFALPNTPSSLAPDEGSYAFYARIFRETSPIEIVTSLQDAGPLGRSLTVPAGILSKTGLSELDSIRAISSFYGLLTLIVITILVLRINNESKILNYKHEQVIVLIFVSAFAFWPSHFLWSILGLRESATELGIVVVLSSIYLLYYQNKNSKFRSVTFTIIGFLLVFMTRPQVGWLLFLSLVIFILIDYKNDKSKILALAIFIGVSGGYIISTPIVQKASPEFSVMKLPETTSSPTTSETTSSPTTSETTSSPTTSETTSSPTTSETTSSPTTSETTSSPASPERMRKTIRELCNFDGESIEVDGQKYSCTENSKGQTRVFEKTPIKSITENIEGIPYAQQVRAVGAASAIKPLPCPFNLDQDLNKYLCAAWRAPYMTLTFLVRPFPILDTTSVSSGLASAENLAWLAVFSFIIIRTLKNKRLVLIRHIYPASLFLVFYSIGAGSFQGNMGTAFRHKSLILSQVLLIVCFLLLNKSRDAEKKSNSQESAV